MEAVVWDDDNELEVTNSTAPGPDLVDALPQVVCDLQQSPVGSNLEKARDFVSACKEQIRILEYAVSKGAPPNEALVNELRSDIVIVEEVIAESLVSPPAPAPPTIASRDASQEEPDQTDLSALGRLAAYLPGAGARQGTSSPEPDERDLYHRHTSPHLRSEVRYDVSSLLDGYQFRAKES